MKNTLPQIETKDGLFHNGNPATGTQGTRVTAEWLNNVQDRLRDLHAELKTVLTKAGIEPNAAKVTQLYEAIISIIDNKKSDSVSSQSSSTLATSKAVKSAFDKGVEALNKANDVDNKTLKKRGEQVLEGVLKTVVMSGWSRAQYGSSNGTWNVEFHPNPTNSQDRRLNIFHDMGGVYSYLRFPHFNDGETVAYHSWVNARIQSIINSSPAALDTLKELADALGNDPHFSRTVLNKIDENKRTASQANNNANGRVAKSGDTMTGDLHIRKSGSDWSGVHLYNTGGYELRMESMPHSGQAFINMSYLNAQNGALHSVSFPKSGLHKVVAYQDWVNARIQSIINSSPAALDTLKELADALGNDPNFSRTVLNKIDENKRAANQANTNATNANNNANTRVLLSGGRAQIPVQDSAYGGINISRTGKAGSWDSRLEALPDRRWKFWTNSDNKGFEQYVKAENGTLAFLHDIENQIRALPSKVVRRDYTRTIKGTSSWDNGTSKNITVTGQTILYPDGKIEQFLHFKNFKVMWFGEEEAVGGHERARQIPVQLWTAMPQKITYATAQFSRSQLNNATAGAEAEEWTMPLWNLWKQGNLRDQCYFTTSRFTGGHDELVDFIVKVEGY